MNYADRELARMTGQPATIAEARQAVSSARERWLATKHGSRAYHAASKEYQSAWDALRALRVEGDA